MKSKLRFIIVGLFSCIGYPCLIKTMETTLGHRRLIMIMDPDGQEVSTSDSSALMSVLIAGLEQQAAPLLVSESLWGNFVTRRHRYSELLQTDQLYKAHYANYLKVLDAIHNLTTTQDPLPFEVNKALRSIKVSEEELQPRHPMHTKINDDFVSYKTHFDPSQWTIRHIPDFAYLLVPNSYKQQLIRSISPAYLKSVLSSTSKIPTPIDLTIFDNLNAQGLPSGTKLTARELILGLKIDHLPPMNDPLRVPQEAVNPKQNTATEAVDLSKLFVTRRDLRLITPHLPQKSNENYERYLVTWNLYLTGHGSPFDPAYDLSSIESGNQQVATLKQQLQEIEKQEKEAGNAPSDASLIQDKIKSIQQAIVKLQSRITSGKHSTIAGLEVGTFKKVLSFFNTYIDTGLLFYNTCFGSGKNLEAPYQYEDIPQTYNYTIVSGASVDASTTVTKYYFFLPPYYPITKSTEVVNLDKEKKFENQFLSSIEIRNGQVDLTLKLEQNFTHYFEQLEQYQTGITKETLADIFNTIQAFRTPEGIAFHNIPLVRYPNTQWFRVIDINKFTTSITEQAVITHQAENEPFLLIDEWGPSIVLLYTSHISVPIILRGMYKKPTILSMIGGTADHYFEKISAKDIQLSDLVRGFMPITGQHFTKRFFIKKLTCIMDYEYEGPINKANSETTTLHNVIIINNDKKSFITEFPEEEVNVLSFLYKGENTPEASYLAVWPKEQGFAKIPGLRVAQATDIKTMTYLNDLFTKASQVPESHKEKLAGRSKIIAFIKERAVPIVQNYKTIKDTKPQELSGWLAALTPDERRIINIMEGSEKVDQEPTLTKEQYNAWRSAIERESNKKSIPQIVPLENALHLLELNLRNVERILRQ